MSARVLTEELRRLMEAGPSVFDLFGFPSVPDDDDGEEETPTVSRKDVTEVVVEPTWIDDEHDKVWKKVLTACFEKLFPNASVRIDPVSASSNDADLYVNDEPVDGIDMAFAVDSFNDFMDDLQSEFLDSDWGKDFEPGDSSVFRALKRKLK